jgi:hypothetical protein
MVSQNKRTLDGLVESRQEWIDILVKNPDNTLAPLNISSINSKIELLRTMRMLDNDYDED